MQSNSAGTSPDRSTAPTGAADWAVAAATGVFALLGLFIAARAHDAIFGLFGWSLLIFGLAFLFGVVRGHYDRLDRAAEAGRPSRPQA